MHKRLGRNTTKPFTPKPKDDPTAAEDGDQSHVHQKRRFEATCDRPRREEFADPVSPKVLVAALCQKVDSETKRDKKDLHCDCDKYRARRWLIAVDGVSAGDGRQCCDLDTQESIPDHDNDLPRPVAVIPNGSDHTPDDHDDYVWNHRHQSHLRLAHAIILRRQSRRHPIAKWAACDQPDEPADKHSQVEKPDGLGREVVRGRGEDLGLGQVDDQEPGRRPRDYEGGKVHDREQVQVQRHPQLAEQAARVRLEQQELLLARPTLAERRVDVRGHGRDWRAGDGRDGRVVAGAGCFFTR